LSKSAVIFEEPLPKQVAPTVSNETGPAPRHAPQNIPIPQIGSNAFKQSVPWVLGVLICLAIALGLALRSKTPPPPSPFNGPATVRYQALALRKSPGSSKRNWILFLPQGTRLMLLGEVQYVENGTWVRARVENQKCKFGIDSRDPSKWTEQIVLKEE